MEGGGRGGAAGALGVEAYLQACTWDAVTAIRVCATGCPCSSPNPPLLHPPLPGAQAEQMIVDAVRSGYFQARFDHKNNTVHFGGQEVESERVRGHIATMAKRLTR